MTLESLAQRARDALETPVASWPEAMNAFLDGCRDLAASHGVDAETFADQLELPEGFDGIIAFVPTSPPALSGVSDATQRELERWASAPGAGTLFAEYGLLPCLEGAAWPADAFADGTLDPSAFLSSPSLGPHAVLDTLILDGFLVDEDAPPLDEVSPGDWLLAPPTDTPQRWLVLTDEYRERAILAALHLASPERPFPVFWCDWMDEIGLVYLGGTAHEALALVLRDAIGRVVKRVEGML